MHPHRPASARSSFWPILLLLLGLAAGGVIGFHRPWEHFLSPSSATSAPEKAPASQPMPAPALPVPPAEASASLAAELAAVYAAHGRQEEARSLFQQAAERETAPSARADALLGWGIALLRQGKIDVARQRFADALAIPSEDPDRRESLLRRLARAYHDAGRLDDFIAELKERVRADDSDTVALEVLAHAQWHLQQDGAAAAPLFERLAVLLRAPEEKAYYFDLAAQAYLKIGNPDSAQPLLERAASLAPSPAAQALYQLRLGEACRMRGRFEEARRAFAFAEEHGASPAVRAAARQQALDLAAAGEGETRAKEYRKRLAADPKDAEALQALADIQWRVEKDLDKALASYEELRALRPGDESLPLRIAALQAERKNYDEAIKLYQAALEGKTGPGEAILLEQLASLYATAQRTGEALACADRIAARGGATSFDLQRLASLYRRLQAPAKAAQTLLHAAQIAGTAAERDESLLQAAAAYRDAGNPAEAARLLREAVAQMENPALRERAQRLLAELSAAAKGEGKEGGKEKGK